MQIASSSQSSGNRAGGRHAPAHEKPLLGLMMGMFFAFGFCTVLVDSLVPKMQEIFHLDTFLSNLTASAYFIAYFLVSAPAGWLIGKIGYLRAMTVGLIIMVAGCALFTPAASIASYPAFLGALFILASGVTIVQAAANPLTGSLGDPAKSSARLTLAQAFNSVATMIGPIFGSAVLLAQTVKVPEAGTVSPQVLTHLRAQAAQTLTSPYLGIAACLALLALGCWLVRRWAPHSDSKTGGSFTHLLGNRRLLFGTFSIFAYVGAEVAIGSNMVFYLKQPNVLAAHLPGLGAFLHSTFPFIYRHELTGAAAAGALISFYWGGAMVGRFIGAAVLSRVKPSLVLLACAACAGLLTLTSGLTAGVLAAVTLLMVGLFNSIQFPTIFTQAVEGLGDDTPEGSGLLCLAIVGGAVVPAAVGGVAVKLGLSIALFIPVICYVWIALYAFMIARGALEPATSTGGLAPAPAEAA